MVYSDFFSFVFVFVFPVSSPFFNVSDCVFCFWQAFPLAHFSWVGYMPCLRVIILSQSCWVRLTSQVLLSSFQEMKTPETMDLFTQSTLPPTWLLLSNSHPHPTQSLPLWNNSLNPNWKAFWWITTSPGPAQGSGSVSTSTCLKMTKEVKHPLRVAWWPPTRPGLIPSRRDSMDSQQKSLSLPRPSKSPLRFWPNPNCK